MKGWRAGVGNGVVDTKFTEHSNQEIRDLYDEGYKRGVKERRDLQTELCKRFDYEPQILRATDVQEEP
jgi:hypothetical protein